MANENDLKTYLVNKDMSEDVQKNPNPPSVTVGTSKRIVRKVTVLDPQKIAKLGFGEKIIQAVAKLKETSKTDSLPTPVVDQHLNKTSHPRPSVHSKQIESPKYTQRVEKLNKDESKKKILKTNFSTNSSENIKSALQERIRQRYRQLKNQKNSESPQSSGCNANISNTSKPKLPDRKADESLQDEPLFGFSVDEISEGSASLRRLSLALERIKTKPTNKIPSFGNLKKYLDSRKVKTVQCEKIDITCEQKKPSLKPAIEPVSQTVVPSTVTKSIPVSVIRRPAKDSSVAVVNKSLEGTVDVKSNPVDSNQIDSGGFKSKDVVISTDGNLSSNSVPENTAPTSTDFHSPFEPVIQPTKPSNKGIIVLDEKIFISSKPQPNNLRYPDIINYASQFKMDCLQTSIKPTNQSDRTTIVKLLAHNKESEEIKIEVVDPLLNTQSPKKTVDPIRSICKSYVRKMMKTSGIKHIKINTPHTTNELNLEESPTKLVIPKTEPPGVHESHSELASINYSMIDSIEYGQYAAPARNSIEPVEYDNDVKPVLDSNAAHGFVTPMPGDDALDAVEFILNCAQNDGIENNSGFDDEDDFEEVEWGNVGDFDNDAEISSPSRSEDMHSTELGQETSIDNSTSCGVITSSTNQLSFGSDSGNPANRHTSFSTTLHPAKVFAPETACGKNAFTFTGPEQLGTHFPSTFTSIKNEPLTPEKHTPTHQIELNVVPTLNDIEYDAQLAGPLKKRKRTILNYMSSSSQVNEITERVKKRLLNKTKTSPTFLAESSICEADVKYQPKNDIGAHSSVTSAETEDESEGIVYTVVEIQDVGGKSAQSEGLIDDPNITDHRFAVGDASISPENDSRVDTKIPEGTVEQVQEEDKLLPEVKKERIDQEQVNEFVINELPTPETLPTVEEPKLQSSAAIKNKRLRLKEVPILCKRSRPPSKVLETVKANSHCDQTDESQKIDESSISVQAGSAEKTNSIENSTSEASRLELADTSTGTIKQRMIDKETSKEIVAITFQNLLDDVKEEKNFKSLKTEHSNVLQSLASDETPLVPSKRREKSPRAVRVRNRHDSVRNRESLIKIAESLKINTVSNTDGSEEIFDVSNVANIYESSERFGNFEKESETLQNNTEQESSLTREIDGRMEPEFHETPLEDDTSAFTAREDDSIKAVQDSSIRRRRRKPTILHSEDYEQSPLKKPADKHDPSYSSFEKLPIVVSAEVKKKRGRKKKNDIQSESAISPITNISAPTPFDITEPVENRLCLQNNSQHIDSNFQSTQTTMPFDVETPPRRKRGRPRKHPIIGCSPSAPRSPASEKEHIYNEANILPEKRGSRRRHLTPQPEKRRKTVITDYYEDSNVPLTYGSEEYDELQGVDEITIENEQIGGETIEPYGEAARNNTYKPIAEKKGTEKTAQTRRGRNSTAADFYIHPRLLLVTNREELGQDDNDTIVEGAPMDVDRETLPKKMVQCGVCKEIIANKFYIEHVKGHHCVGWRVGLENPINMSSYRGVLNAMFYFMKRHKVSTLKCKVCGDVKKSAAGFLAHLQTCLLNEDQLAKILATCKFCGKQVMPQSMRSHLKYCRNNPDNQKTPKVEDMHKNADVKRKSAIKASSTFKSMIDSSYKLSVDDFIKPYEQPRGSGVALKWKNDIKKTGVAQCYAKNCNFESSHMDDLREHVKICRIIPRDGFFCTRCKYWNLQENEVRKHISEKHKKHLNVDCQIEQDTSRNARKETDFTVSECDLLAESADESSGDEGRCRSMNSPKFSRTRVRDFHAATRKIYDRMHSEFVLYPEWRPHVICSHSHFDMFKPTLKNSINFGFTPFNIINRRIGASHPPNNWHKLIQFKSKCIEGENVIFIGGPVTRCTWIPLPNEGRPDTVEYLAVTYKKTFTSHTKVVDANEEESLILVYKIEFSDLVSSELLYGVRCIGPINDFAFMPSGGYAPDINRLAVMAVGNVKPEINLYALPLKAIGDNCDTISVDNLSGRILDLKSNLVLCIELSESNGTHSKIQCTRLNWSEMRNHNIIAAGFSNGFVGLWDIRHNEDNLTMHQKKDQICFLPVSYFHTMAYPVSGIALHYNQDEPRWLVVSNVIREFHVYNLEDMSNPLPILKEGFQRSGISSAVWSLYSENPTMSFNDDYAEDICMALTRSLNNVTYKVKYDVHCATGINTLAFTPWHNAIISGCENGDIMIQRFRTYSMESSVANSYPRKYVYFSDVVRLDGSSIPNVKPKEVSECMDSEKLTSLDSFNEEYIETHGLVFGGHIPCSRDNKAVVKANDRIVPYSLRPLTRINHVAICTNMPNLDVTAIAYHNGLIRIRSMDYKRFI